MDPGRVTGGVAPSGLQVAVQSICGRIWTDSGEGSRGGIGALVKEGEQRDGVGEIDDPIIVDVRCIEAAGGVAIADQPQL